MTTDNLSYIAGLMRNRRTIHDFTDKKVDDALLLTALDTAQWAPNHRLTHPCKFYILGEQIADDICVLNSQLVAVCKGVEAGAAKLKRWQGMPNWLIITSQLHANPIQTQEDYATAACIVQNLSLLLWEQGIGMKWSSGDIIRDARLYELIGADSFAEQIVGLFWYGYPAKTPVTRRPDLADQLVKLP